MRRKAVTADVLRMERESILAGRHPELEPQLRGLAVLRSQVARKLLDGPGPEGPDSHQRLLAEWRTRIEAEESALARQLTEVRVDMMLRQADRTAVAHALPPGTALVDFVRFHAFDFLARGASVSRWGPARYVAFVHHAGDSGPVQMLDLGEAGPIDAAIAGFRAAVAGHGADAGSRDLGAPSEAGRSDESTAGRRLGDLVFAPVEKSLAGCRRLFIAPDADLARVPFEALPAMGGGHVIDEYSISYLSGGRELLRLALADEGQVSAPVVAADPDFDLRATRGPADAERPERGRMSRDLVGTGVAFGRLAGTRVEGLRVASRLGVEPWLEQHALEERVKALRSPAILHLATHGFFLQDQERNPDRGMRDLGSLDWSGGSGRLVGRRFENPLLRSGLALAGANTWLRQGPLPPEAEDGILTAEDVAGLDLHGTHLVVLSACDTGLGETRRGEGVFGLRRAFSLAGARTLVMSLWKVPDAETQELMELFYDRLLAGEPRPDALRAAQLRIKHKDPRTLAWGGFVCQGDFRPLPRTVLGRCPPA
jgi:CHAT domain-containing protein